MKNIFLTGRPGIGKTTIIKEWIKRLGKVEGFYTEEIRKNNKRVGFKIITFNGREGILASTESSGKFKVGSYRVNLKDLEEIGVSSIKEALSNKDIRVIIIDEIGKMELFSAEFQKIVEEALNSPKKVIGVITQSSFPFVSQIKKRLDTEIVEVTRENRIELINYQF